MATNESMAIRCNAALERIEGMLSDLEGVPLPDKDEFGYPIPRINRDVFMLRVVQLEAIAEWLGRIHSPVVESVSNGNPKRK